MASENTLRYVKTDYQSHKDALLQRVRARWGKVWNDFLANSVATMLVDLIAWTTTTWAFLINRVAGENFVSTMTLRESAVRIGTLTGYKLHGPIPASLLCEATLSAPASGSSSTVSVQILKGTVVRVGTDNLPFEVSKDYDIYGGQTSPVSKVVTLDASLSGAQALSTNVVATNNSPYLDLVDSSVDLSLYAEPGQTVRLPQPSTDTQTYVIQSIETSPNSTSSGNRIVVDPPWNSNVLATAQTIAVEIIDQRILLSQGQTVNESFSAPTIETPGYLIKLSKTPLIDNSTQVTVNGILWEEVDFLNSAASTDKAYEVSTLATDDTIIKFGDGVNGEIVPTEASVEVTYKIGGGVKGNVPLNSVNTSITGRIVSLSNPVSVLIKNSSSTGQGGRDAETLEEARVNIPYHTRANDRAVTLDDWQTLARSYSDPVYGSVAYARTGVRTDNSLLEGNIVLIYAWTTGPNGNLVALSSQLKSAVTTYLETKAVGTDLPLVVDGTERPVPVSLRFKVFSGYNVDDTAALVDQALQDYVLALRPGSPVVHSDLLRALDEVSGVDSVSMATPSSDLIASSPNELFTSPSADYIYDISRRFTTTTTAVVDTVVTSVNRYSAQLPIYPMAVWSFKLFLGETQLTVISDTVPGYARILGTGIVDDDGDAVKSTVNLLTGKVDLALVGTPGDLTMQLNSAQGYRSERLVNLYIGYTGINSADKRAEIRATLRNWSEGLAVGGTIFGQEVSSVSVSRSNVKAVVNAIDGVIDVTRVALGSPTSNNDRIVASENELIRLSTIVLNNRSD